MGSFSFAQIRLELSELEYAYSDREDDDHPYKLVIWAVEQFLKGPEGLHIRNGEGKFSPGGSRAEYPSTWNSRGKTWKSIGALRNHLAYLFGSNRDPERIPEDWVVVWNDGREKSAREVYRATYAPKGGTSVR